MKFVLFLISIVAFSSIGFALAQTEQSGTQVACLIYQDINLVVVQAVEQFTTAPLFCEGHENTISTLLGSGWHIAAANQFEVFLTK